MRCNGWVRYVSRGFEFSGKAYVFVNVGSCAGLSNEWYVTGAVVICNVGDVTGEMYGFVTVYDVGSVRWCDMGDVRWCDVGDMKWPARCIGRDL